MDQSEGHGETKRLEELLSAPVLKRSVRVSGHPTSVTLEQPFWEELKFYAEQNDLSLNRFISTIDEARPEGINLSSALRLFVLETLKRKIFKTTDGHR